MKADTIKAALSTTAMKTPRNDMALSSSILQNQGRFPLNRPRTRGNPGEDGSLISVRPGASRAQGAERLRCLASGSARFIQKLCEPRDSKPRKTQCNAPATAGQEPGSGSHIPLQVPAGHHIEGWQTSSL